MSSILQELHKKSFEKATSSLEFSNAGAMSDISKKYIEKYKTQQAGSANPETSLLKEMREKNLHKVSAHSDFSNDLVQSDISRKYIEKYKASQEPVQAKGSASLLESLRKKNMDATTGNM